MQLSDVLAEVRNNLSAFPNAMLGEIGLDRTCRVPLAPPSPPPYVLHDKPRQLSPFTIPLDHQVAVLEAQFDLAVELKRNVSFHSVKSQQATVELLDRLRAKHGAAWYAISVDMHSCGLSTETWKDIEVCARANYPVSLTDAAFRGGMQMYSCHSRRLSTRGRPHTRPSFASARRIAFWSNLTTTTLPTWSRRRGTWSLPSLKSKAGQSRSLGRITFLRTSGVWSTI